MWLNYKTITSPTSYPGVCFSYQLSFQAQPGGHLAPPVMSANLKGTSLRRNDSWHHLWTPFPVVSPSSNSNPRTQNLELLTRAFSFRWTCFLSRKGVFCGGSLGSREMQFSEVFAINRRRNDDSFDPVLSIDT